MAAGRYESMKEPREFGFDPKDNEDTLEGFPQRSNM